MSVKKFKTTRRRSPSEEAMSRLRQRWEREHEDEDWEPEKEPVVTPMFKAVEGGIPVVISALHAHSETDAQDFIETYNQCSATDRKHLPLEAIAFAAGISSLRLAEVAQTALYLYSSAQTKMLVASSMVRVTKAIVKAATDEVPITAYNSETGMQEVVGKTNGDVKAMELFGKIGGIVPVPKGAQIFINNQPAEKEDERDDSPRWKNSGERLREFQAMTDPKRLPSPETSPVNIGGHIDHMQAETVEIMRGN